MLLKKLESGKNGVLAIYVLLCIFSAFVLPFDVHGDDSSFIVKQSDRVAVNWKERLHLTEEQWAKAKSVLLESSKKSRDIIENSMLDGKTKMGALQQIKWSADMQLSQILTEEQMTEYQRIHEEMKRELLHDNKDIGGEVRGSNSRGNSGFRSGLKIGF